MGSLLSRRDRLTLEDGRQLRLLSALEVLEARREAEELARDRGERALWANACLLARAVEQGGEPVFASGREVLERMSAREVARLASPEQGEEAVRPLKKAWSTRLMNAFAGACSGRSEPSRRRSGSER